MVSDSAPGRLEVIRLFENTVELPNGPDELDSVDRAAAWCRAHDLPPPSTRSELERLRAFREALRGVLFANNGEAELAGAWDGVRPFAGSVRLGLSVARPDDLQLEPAPSDGDGAIASLLALIHDSLVNGTWSRLRACRKTTCRFAYYDRTKNGSRAWCSMATCGNQAKAKRRRERERRG
jgi:predicted RNA-binding Zn ribbon-like protein